MKKPIPFGKYMLLERVNVGGMAEVFKAKAFGVEGFERLVAVKRILPSIAEDSEFITMFIDEAKIAVQLTHANIAQIFDLGRVTDSYFIAMEYVHGKDLRAIFDRARKRGETVPVPMACYNVMKVCEGLDYAHNKKDAAGRELNLVHRDVSPQNILISYDGETKIIDFGIAKAAGKAGKTQAGILKGKFGYMSPEQVRGLPLDRRSDIFAVGIVLYELLTGERLFVGESDFSTLEKVRNVEIMPPSTYNRRIPEELEQIVLKALAKDVDDRYQTAMDLHDDLQSFMYTSGNFFSRKDLSAYMRKAFAEEIAKESQREEEYRRMEAEVTAGGSGLDAFADLEPATAKAANISAAQPPPRPPSPPGKRTRMGMGSIPPPPPRSSGGPPPPPPGGRSVPPPPPRSASNPSNPSVPAVAPAATTSGEGAAFDMDWDDEELSTQIYDKPEGGEMPGKIPALEADPFDVESMPDEPYAAAAAPSQPSFTPPSARPARSSPGSIPGAPSPFSQPAPAPSSPPPRPSMGPEPTAVTRKEERGGNGMFAAMLGLLAVVGLGVGAAAVWWLVLRPQPGVIQLTTDPADAVVYLDGQPITSANASPWVITNVEPGSHHIEVRKHGYRSWETTVILESGSSLPMPAVTLSRDDGATDTPGTEETPAVAAAEGTGFVLESVPPGATVTVNGNAIEQRTPATVTDLTAGTYTVRAELAGYAPWTGQIDVVAGQIARPARAVLTQQPVSVRFESDPTGAEVTLVRGSEERRVGETPTTSDVDVSGEAWTVRMTRNGHEDWSEPLAAPAGASRHTVRAELERSGGDAVARRPNRRPNRRPPPDRGGNEETASAGGGGQGTLRVNSQPWSEVYVDGRRIGNTPQMNIPVTAGRHTITFVNPEFNIREQVTVTVGAGQTETLIQRLTPG